MEAVESYIRRNPIQLAVSVREVLVEMLETKRGNGLSEGYLQHLGYDLEKIRARIFL